MGKYRPGSETLLRDKFNPVLGTNSVVYWCIKSLGNYTPPGLNAVKRDADPELKKLGSGSIPLVGYSFNEDPQIQNLAFLSSYINQSYE